MSLFGKQSDRTIAQLVAEAKGARGRKDFETSTRLLRRAADTLLLADRTDDAIELLAREREYATAAELCERKKADWTRAAKLWFRAGNFVRSAKALVRNGDDAAALTLLEDAKEYADAARIHERLRNFAKASALFEKAGDKLEAANALVQLLRGEEGKKIGKDELQATCRQAAALYTEAGEVERAAKILRWAGQNQLGAQLLVKHEQPEAAAHYEQAQALSEADRMYELSGDDLGAAQAAEQSGDLAAAAGHYERLGQVDEAARCLRAAGKEADAHALVERTSGQEEMIRELATHDDHLNAAIGYTALARKGDRACYASAIEHLVQIPADSSEHLQAQTMLAEIYGEMGDRNRGIDILQKVLRGVTPGVIHVPAIYLRGRLLELEGYRAAAREHYKTAVGIDPSFMDVSKRLAMLQTRAVSAPNPSDTPPRRLPSIEVKSSEATRRTPLDGTRRPPPEAIRSTPPEGTPAGAPSEGTPPAIGEATASRPKEGSDVALRPGNLVGVVLRGRFRIERRIGVGGQAQVYLARDIVLERSVAIKVLNEHIASDLDAIERFLREARYAARVHHPKCISVFDFGQERGLTFMAMEYFEGTTLRERLKAGALPFEEALRIGCDIAEALVATHTQGIIHRDVKPSNIMVNASGGVRLADFGVARNRDEETSARGMMVGSMAYMPPEQANGKEADARADVFSLGAVVYEMLSGERPFESTIEGLVARVDRPPPMLPERVHVPERVRWMIRRAMQPKPADRYPSMDLFLADLKPVLDDLAPSRALDLAMTTMAPPALANPPELRERSSPPSALDGAKTTMMPSALESAMTTLMPPPLEGAMTALMPSSPPSALDGAETRMYPARTLEDALGQMAPSALDGAETRMYPARTLENTLGQMAPLTAADRRMPRAPAASGGLETANTTFGTPWGLEGERLVGDLLVPPIPAPASTPPAHGTRIQRNEGPEDIKSETSVRQPASFRDAAKDNRTRDEGGMFADEGQAHDEDGPDEALWHEPTS